MNPDVSRYFAAAKDVSGAARQRVADRARGRAVVLCYHRVADLEQDPQLLAVAPERFRDHVAMLRERFKPLALGELVERRRDLPRRTVVLTFDDGYADNLETAAPLLEGAEVPATVFVTTGFTEAGREFWWDELERLLLVREPGGELALRDGDVERRWQLAGADDRRRAYQDVHAWLRPLPTETIEDVLRQLRAFAGEPEGGDPRRSHRQLDADELARLDASPVVELGAHTVTHPSLARQPVPVQRDEIVRSREALEQRLGRPVRSMSYPFGSRLDQSRTTVRLAREAGYACAAANFPGLVGALAKPWHLPRVLVRNWEADELERRLHAMLGPA